MTYYTVGENVPGYLPESDSYTTKDRESAADYAVSLVDSYLDSLADRYPDADTAPLERELDYVRAHLTDEFTRSPLTLPEWSWHMRDGHRDHDLGLSVWINASPERPDCDCGDCEVCADAESETAQNLRGDCTPGPDGWCSGGCITRPHVWSPGGRCQRTGCNVAGTGDACNDGNCTAELS